MLIPCSDGFFLSRLAFSAVGMLRHHRFLTSDGIDVNEKIE